MGNPVSEVKVRELIAQEVEKKLNELIDTRPITREEFLKAIEALEKRFEAVDRRFEELIESMNQRFKAVDRRFEELIESMNQRFEAVDRRFEELIESMNQRFEAVDRRFEAVDRRFEELIESMNQRFEAVDRRFEELIESMNQRFEAVDRRFEAVDRRFEAVDRRFEELIESMNRGFLTLKVAIGSLGHRSGIRLEKTILKLLQKTLEQRDIDINKVQWVELVDEQGEVFSKHYRTDIDVLMKDGLHFLMEVKYKADSRDIFHFLRVAELYARQYRRPNKLILVTLDLDSRTQEYAERENIEIITGDYD
ncbi:MAG: DUF3782 domain-containing protein [Candidatus Helarchaeota archaeon]